MFPLHALIVRQACHQKLVKLTFAQTVALDFIYRGKWQAQGLFVLGARVLRMKVPLNVPDVLKGCGEMNLPAKTALLVGIARGANLRVATTALPDTFQKAARSTVTPVHLVDGAM